MNQREWRKSSFSGTQSNCVELAWDDTTPLIRDTKGTPDAVLRVPASSWRTFLDTH